MKVIRYIPAAAAGAGIFGAVLRGMNLHTGYELGTHLPIAGNIPQMLLVTLTIAIGILLLLGTRFVIAREGVDFVEVFGCQNNTGYKAIAVVLALVMGGAGVIGLYQTVNEGLRTDTFMMIPLWLLTLGTMLAFIIVASAQARGSMNESHAGFTLVPMFWACIDLIITFQDNASSPFVSLYAFELLAAICLMFAFYAFAGFLYASGNPARFLLTASLAVFFCFTCVGGYLVAALLGGTTITLHQETILRYACFAAGALFLLANITICTKRLTYVHKH